MIGKREKSSYYPAYPAHPVKIFLFEIYYHYEDGKLNYYGDMDITISKDEPVDIQKMFDEIPE